MSMVEADSGQLLQLAVGELMADPSQPRRTFPPDELERLRASIAARGILQPLRVTFDEERQKWRIIVGESRWRAACLAGLATVPCLPVISEVSETDILADQIIENTCRNALRPLELARSLVKLKALMQANSQTIAKQLGISGAAVTRAEALLRLPDDIQALVDNGRISESAAYSISRLGDESQMRELAAEVASGRKSRDEVAEAVQQSIAPKDSKCNASRLSCKLPDTGVSVTVSGGGKPLTVKALLDAINRIRQAAGKLKDDAAISELNAILRPQAAANAGPSLRQPD